MPTPSPYELRTLTKGDNVIGLWRPSFTRLGSKLYLFGGGGMVSNNMSIFDINKSEWVSLKGVEGTPPSKRYGHSTVLYNEKLIVFGGINEFQEYCNDIIVFDFKKKLWYRPEIKGDGIPARYFHTSTVYGDKMYTYGGFSRNSECTYVIDKLNILDLKQFSWTSSVAVPSRYNHSATLIRDTLYIFAGKDEVGNTVSDLISVDLSISEPKVIKQQMPNCNILLKSQHFSEAMGDSLLIFGKVVEECPPSSAFGLWRLDLPLLKWTVLDTRQTFADGVWNYFTVAPKLHNHHDLLGDEPLFPIPEQNDEKLDLIFLGNEDKDRPQPYDHFRDMIRLDPECLGIWQPPQPTLALDLLSILTDQSLCDFTLISMDNKEIPVHKLILLARWPYFQKLTQSCMEESLACTLKVDGSLSACTAMVNYIYTDQIDSTLDWQIAGELLFLASFYLLPRLKKLTCEILHRNLSISTCSHILHFATAANEPALQTVAGHFILEHLGEVANTTDLATLPEYELRILLGFIPKDAKIFPKPA